MTVTMTAEVPGSIAGALALAPRDPESVGPLRPRQREGQYNSAIEILQEVVVHQNLPFGLRIGVGYELAHALDAAGCFDEAFNESDQSGSALEMKPHFNVFGSPSVLPL